MQQGRTNDTGVHLEYFVAWHISSTRHLVQEALEVLQGLSPALAAASPHLPASAGESLLGCLQRAACPCLLATTSKPFAASILQDVDQLAGQGRAAILCALCDLHRLILAALSQLSMRADGVRGNHELSGKQAHGEPGAKGRSLPGLATAVGPHLPLRLPRGAAPQAKEQEAAVLGWATRPESKAHVRSMRGSARHAERKVWFLMCYINEQGPAMCTLLHQSSLTAIDELSAAPFADTDVAGRSIPFDFGERGIPSQTTIEDLS